VLQGVCVSIYIGGQLPVTAGFGWMQGVRLMPHKNSGRFFGITASVGFQK
jgi:hypothetical protein